MLTVVSDCNGLEEVEAVLGLQSGDLSMRELRKELRLLIVFIVDVASRQI